MRLAADMVPQPGRAQGLHDVHFAVAGERRWVDREGRHVDTPPDRRLDIVPGADGEPMQACADLTKDIVDRIKVPK